MSPMTLLPGLFNPFLLSSCPNVSAQFSLGTTMSGPEFAFALTLTMPSCLQVKGRSSIASCSGRRRDAIGRIENGSRIDSFEDWVDHCFWVSSAFELSANHEEE